MSSMSVLVSELINYVLWNIIRDLYVLYFCPWVFHISRHFPFVSWNPVPGTCSHAKAISPFHFISNVSYNIWWRIKKGFQVKNSAQFWLTRTCRAHRVVQDRHHDIFPGKTTAMQARPSNPSTDVKIVSLVVFVLSYSLRLIQFHVH